MTLQSPKLNVKQILTLVCSLSLFIALICFVAGQPVSIAGAEDSPAKIKQDPGKKKPDAKNIREQTPVQVFMRAKLEDNSVVLEGLMTNQFEQIVEAAEHLQLMSTATEWQVIQGPIYKQHSTEFRRAAEQLKIDAQKKNLDAVALDYVHMTMTCVSCHKFVRSTQLAGGNIPPIALPELRVSQLHQHP